MNLLFRFVVIVLMVSFTFGCNQKSPSQIPDSNLAGDTLWVNISENILGYPQSGVTVYHTPDTINYLYSPQLGNIHFTVTLDDQQVPDSGSFIMNRNHRMSASCENKVIWKLPLEKQVYYGCPVVADDGTIYVSTGIFRYTDWGSVYAVDPGGNIQWSFDCEYNPYSPVIGCDGGIYVQDFHNKVYAIEPDGSLKWTFNDFENQNIIFYDMGQRIPAIGADGVVYIASDGLYALDPETGARLWRFNPRLGKSCRQSPVIGPDGTIYIFIHQHDFYAVNPSGTQKWHIQLDSEEEMSFACPAIDQDGTLYIGAERGSAGFVYCFDAQGNKRWKYIVDGAGRTVRASPVIGSDGTVYIATKAGGVDIPAKIIALSPAGSRIWEFIVDNFHGAGSADDVYSTPSVGFDGTLYFGSENEHFYALHPDGSLKWKTQLAHGINWSSAAICDDGTLYIGTQALTKEEDPLNGGNLYALRTDSYGYAASPWPRFRCNNRNDGRFR
ncbi:MAG: PQQ-binding-like beta-propeller repeat protein [candidate division KSB1 bacterium]|jgi:outer membrane protein assembly factor BamB|nr:PQQ-binding-like beta-propeller repeat protein [candidate division KSB1 bacterium]